MPQRLGEPLAAPVMTLVRSRTSSRRILPTFFLRPAAVVPILADSRGR